MHVCRQPDAVTFLSRATDFLQTSEAQHNILLGIAGDIVRGENEYQPPLYFATVEEAGTVIVAAMRTPPHMLHLSVAPMAAIELLAQDIHASYPALPGVLGPPEVARAFAEVWRQMTDQTFQPGIAQRIYQLEAVNRPANVRGRLRQATGEDRTLLRSWFTAFHAEAYGSHDVESAARAADAVLLSPARTIYIWDDDEPVSMAITSGSTPNGIRIGSVYTPPRHRGNGYASACVAAVSQHILDAGYRYCFLFTDLANPTSNRIYQRIGYQPIADAGEYVFEGVPVHH